FNSYFKGLLAEQSETSPADDPSTVAASIGETLSEATEVKAAVATARSAVQKAAETSASAVGSEDEVSADLVARSEQVASQISGAMAEAEVALTTIDEYMVRLDTAKARTELLLEEISQLHDQVEQGVEAMSLGLTAEALSHELFNVADGLASRTQQIFKLLESDSLRDSDVRGYFEFVRATVGSLRKELGHFSPSLRYVRDRRETIPIGEFLSDIAAYFEGRASKTPIEVDIRGSSSAFEVRSSRGKLTQVLDNLFLNSEYWMGSTGVAAPKISISVKSPVIVFSDNGPGVEESVEETLFDPFVTRKPRGEGRGLGLFVVRQLLESEGCSIALGPKRNENGRRFQFRINLESILTP
ncbi:MAG: HAMP domain-containing sensor histidine kinase, partial [Solirubrobacterales bacterium]